MELMIEFFTDWRAVLQMAMLFCMIYLAMYHLRNTHGSLVMAGLLMFIGSLWCLAKALDLDVISQLLEMILGSLFLMLMIIFQPELRRALARLGSLAMLENRRRKELINEVISAVLAMAKRKCGALIVIECKSKLQQLIDDAVMLDAKVNSSMLESIFYPNSPLHDGAVIIRDDRIVAARAILPLSGSENISRSLGTRHRAALGISEESDAVTIVVSEETGTISVAVGGMLKRHLAPQTLERLLRNELVPQQNEQETNALVRLMDKVLLSGKEERNDEK